MAIGKDFSQVIEVIEQNQADMLELISQWKKFIDENFIGDVVFTFFDGSTSTFPSLAKLVQAFGGSSSEPIPNTLVTRDSTGASVFTAVTARADIGGGINGRIAVEGNNLTTSLPLITIELDDAFNDFVRYGHNQIFMVSDAEINSILTPGRAQFLGGASLDIGLITSFEVRMNKSGVGESILGGDSGFTHTNFAGNESTAVTFTNGLFLSDSVSGDSATYKRDTFRIEEGPAVSSLVGTKTSLEIRGNQTVTIIKDSEIEISNPGGNSVLTSLGLNLDNGTTFYNEDGFVIESQAKLAYKIISIPDTSFQSAGPKFIATDIDTGIPFDVNRIIDVRVSFENQTGVGIPVENFEANSIFFLQSADSGEGNEIVVTVPETKTTYHLTITNIINFNGSAVIENIEAVVWFRKT